MSKIVFTMGEPDTSNTINPVYVMQVTAVCKKTWYNRFRYWMFFKFFPFEFKEWIDD